MVLPWTEEMERSLGDERLNGKHGVLRLGMRWQDHCGGESSQLRKCSLKLGFRLLALDKDSILIIKRLLTEKHCPGVGFLLLSKRPYAEYNLIYQKIHLKK